MKTSIKIISLILFIPLQLLAFSLHSQAGEEVSVQTKYIQKSTGEDEVSKYIEKGIFKIHFNKNDDNEKRTIKSTLITEAIKRSVKNIDIKNAIIIGDLNFCINKNSINIEESGMDVDEINLTDSLFEIKKACLVSPSINIESCWLQGNLEAGYDRNLKSIVIFERSVSFRGSKFIDKSNFRFASFKENAIFEFANFYGEADFEFASFKKKVYFGTASFKEKAIFEFASFYGEVNFKSASFNGEVNFRSPYFKEKANFEFASFYGEVNFKSASFNGEVNFRTPYFKEKANFEFANFNDEVIFEAASFNDGTGFSSTNFNDEVNFRSASFNGEVNFGEARFNSEAHFMYASFKESAYFGYASFKESAYFGYASFNGVANFEAASFNGEANFVVASFNGLTIFGKANFNGVANFEEASFEEIAIFREGKFKEEVLFRGTNFVMNIDLIRVVYPKLRISWSQLKGLLDGVINNSEDKESGLLGILKVVKKGADLDGESVDEFIVESENDYLEQLRVERLVSWEEVYLKLVRNFEDIGDVESAHDCYYHYRYNKPKFMNQRLGEKSEKLNRLPIKLEFPEHLKNKINYKNNQLVYKGLMTKREKYLLLELSKDKSYKNAIKKLYKKSQYLPEYIVRYGCWEKTKWWGEYILFGLTCGYGVYPFRTLGVMVALILFFTMFYFIGCQVFPDKKNLIFQQGGKSLSDDKRLHYKLYNCFYFSVMTFTTVGYGDLHPKGGFKVAAMIEGFLGWMTMALFLVTLGNVWLR